MQIVAILAFCVVAAVAAPKGYGAPDIRITHSGYSGEHLLAGGYEVAPVLLKTQAFTAPLLKAHVPIIKFLKNDDNYGSYNMELVTGDGISSVETGTLKDLGDVEGPVNVKEGSYSWTSPEGIPFTVKYIADEHGFRASGTHLPTPPPIPQEILKSLNIPRVAEIGYGGYAVPTIRLGGY